MALKEWERSRDVLEKFDEYTHDVRKYGFSFVTALLTAQAILTPSGVPGYIKLGIFLATLVLLVALRLFEKNYELFQRAASSRARILEKFLNLELTETITWRYKFEGILGIVTHIYGIFAIGVGVLGTFVMAGDPLFFGLPWIIPLWIAVGVAIVYIMRISGHSLDFERGLEDWTLDRLECRKDEKIRITLTNLDPEKPILIHAGEILWEIRSEEDSWSSIKYAERENSIEPDYGNYTWLWDPNEVPKGGIYKVTPTMPQLDPQTQQQVRRPWPDPLNRITISEAPPSPGEKTTST